MPKMSDQLSINWSNVALLFILQDQIVGQLTSNSSSHATTDTKEKKKKKLLVYIEEIQLNSGQDTAGAGGVQELLREALQEKTWRSVSVGHQCSGPWFIGGPWVVSVTGSSVCHWVIRVSGPWVVSEL